MKRSLVGLASFGLAVLLGGCASNPGGGDIGPVIRWIHPDHAIEVPDVAEGEKLLSFTPIVSKLPDEIRIYVSDPADIDIDHRGIFFVSKEASGDPYWVIESISEINQDDLRHEMKQCVPPVQCSGSRSMVALRGDHEALLIEKGSQTTGIIWIEDGLRIQVMGPPASFTAGDAIAVANNL